ncbi:hypothetical protein AVEN_133616-1 [Araneus ventricosus]|uniref:Uncharacterized protein n=1 Tax=Araneus ventricosus TaxID=182803 RepID=A0A4Y2PKN8_ARAVE|nr:hypothetical protein AVEN_133616-1 [Araneus ventricosus]
MMKQICVLLLLLGGLLVVLPSDTKAVKWTKKMDTSKVKRNEYAQFLLLTDLVHRFETEGNEIGRVPIAEFS